MKARYSGYFRNDKVTLHTNFLFFSHRKERKVEEYTTTKKNKL